MRYFLLFLFIFPFVEIYTLIVVGSYIGPSNALIWVFFTAIVGIYLLRNQGLSKLINIRANSQTFEPTANNFLKTLFSPIGGFFLLIPGFLTDLIGLMILTPITRILVIGAIFNLLSPTNKMNKNAHGYKSDEDWIEGEYEKDK